MTAAVWACAAGTVSERITAVSGLTILRGSALGVDGLKDAVFQT
jgi:hypothetical protein